MFNFIKTNIADCYEIHTNFFEDTRGRFVKVFHDYEFKKFSLNVNFVEQYYSISLPRVVRGLHFQLPPHDHAKLVYCIEGEVMDIALDLRVGSPTYGKHFSTILTSKKGNMVYLPSGIAHGFSTINKTSTLVYNLTTVHHPESDVGVLWNSAEIEWPNSKPIISNRDQNFPKLKDFVSPFTYNK
jgi:dTDP-4-dehydrorhamnose 3,5-epimerase